MKKRFLSLALAGALMIGGLVGCGKKEEAGIKLDPSNPISLTVWHYYNGSQQAAFDALVSEFNATVGKEEGIHVEGYSQGSVSDLEKAISDSAAHVVGSQPLPDIFSTYADTAFSLQKDGLLTDLSAYFTAEELKEYVPGYIQEGYLQDDGALYLFPVAKSTEILMINATDWEPFAQATGTTTDELATTEGVTRVAQRYYQWTDEQTPDIPDDGKAFYGRDSMSNYFIIGMKQMGKFRSDDMKTGELIAYTGSASSSMYFPDQVIKDDGTYPISYIALPAPVMEGGQMVYVQQGADMAVTKSDAQHEYAASRFLKWFTAKENNLRFVCESAYLPVRNEANTMTALDEVIASKGLSISPKAYDCLKCILDSFDKVSFYTAKCFDNGYATRRVLDFNLSDKAVADKASIDEAVAGGASREEALAPYLTDEAFDAWYEAFCQALEAKAHPQNN